MNYYWSNGIYCKQEFKRRFGYPPKFYERVIFAVMRCSRNRWISGEQVWKLARAFSARTVPHTVTKWVFKNEDMFATDVTGMLMGSRPFERSSTVYREFLDLTKKKRTVRTPPIELQILNLNLKEMKNGN